LANIKRIVKSAARRKSAEEFLETVSIEQAGKSRVYLGGLAQTLHERNLRALYHKMSKE
jgi:cyclase